MAERLYYEARLEALVRKERSFGVQLRGFVRGLVVDDVDAFYLPSRMLVAIVLSVFANVFMALALTSIFNGIDDRVAALDISAIVNMFTGLALLQSQFHAITGSDFFMSGVQDNERFGMNNWQAEWDGKQGAYAFAANLSDAEKAELVNKPAA